MKAAGLDVGPLADPTFNATVFAPTDAAFEAAIEALGVTAEDLLNNTVRCMWGVVVWVCL